MTTKPYYQDDWVTIYHGDCLEVLPALPPCELVLTDPPYGIPSGSAFWRKGGTQIEDWGTAIQNAPVDEWVGGIRHSEDSCVIEFGRGNPEWVLDRVRCHQSAHLKPWRFFVIAKTAPAPSVRPTFASGFEMALVSYSGARRWFGGGATPDRWIGQTPNQLRQSHGHPSEKPLAPFQNLIRALTQEGELVLDPFTGSGTTLVAAKFLGRKAIGIEIEEKYCEIAAKRCAQDYLWGGRE